MFKRSVFAVVAILLAAPAATQNSSPTRPAAGGRDPNRIVCERIEELGTRLGARKVCMTAAEWAEQRRQDRQQIDRLQAGSCVAGAGC